MSDPTPIRYLFIRRPIFAGVISIVILLLGAFALYTLPINRYPRITPPSVQVSAVYPGATAEDVAAAVAAPIEEQLSGLDGLLYFKSSSASDGTMSLQVYFDLSRDLDLAAVDVQNQVSLAQPQLPQEVVRQGITITKAQTDILAVVGLTSKDPRYDATYLNNYATIYVTDELKRLPGVGDAGAIGSLDFSMLLSLDPDRMTRLNLTVADIQAAVAEQNATHPAGRVGREPAPRGNQLTLPVTTLGRLTDPAEFGEIIVRANPDGSLVRIRDVGTVTLGAESYDLAGRVNGLPTAAIRIFLRPGANALSVKQAVTARMNELAKRFPAGVSWFIPFDTTPFITESIREVVKTLAEAMLLVTLVVFIFLQNWRTTLIPVLAVPVAIIGTFFGLQLLGFEINLLTLFALVLAIGIVVDDAIVVIENVERIMAQEGLPPREAADRAMGQVAGALIAIVLSLCAVFLPVAFLAGISGQMYKQFAITLVVAVVISGIVALTLTPALCAVLLRPSHGGSARGFGWFNRGFSRITARYVASVGGVIARPARWIACFVVMLVLIGVLVRRVPTGFIPTEDKGYFAIVVQLPDGASLQRTVEVTKRIEQYLLKQPSVDYVVNFAGLSFVLGTNQTNAASMFVLLKPWDKRTGKGEDLNTILGATNGYLASLNDAVSFGFNLPEIPGLGTTAGLEMNLQDRGVNDIRKFATLVNEFTAKANAEPALQGVQTLMRVNVPQVYVHVDREKAKALGVSLNDVFQTLQTLLSTLYVNDFNLYGRTYRVQLEAQQRFRLRPEDIGRLYVRSSSGAMVPMSTLVHTEIQGGPSLVQRFNGFTSALVTGQPQAGSSSGQMLDAVGRLADSEFGPRGVGYAYSGQSYQEAAVGGGQSALIFLFGMVMVFLVLAAQYESWSIPFAVLLGIPFGTFGAFLGIWLRGLASDVYFQIGLLVVIGLAAKNAILIVEFASELRAQGRSLRDAAIEAARERFRPILMTSFAFILGVGPLVIASGAGAQSRHSIGTGVFFGLLTATTIGIFFIPLFFYLISRLGQRKGSRTAQTVPAGAGLPASSAGDT